MRANLLPAVLTGARRRLFGALVANATAQAVAMVGLALLTRYCFDRFDSRFDGQLDAAWTVAAAVALAVLGIVMVWLRTAERTTAERLGQSYLTETRLRLFDHLNAVPSRILQKRTRGVMMVRFVADLDALNSWVSRGLARLVVSATAAPIALAVLVWVSPVVAVGIAAMLGIVMASLAVLGRALYRRARELRRVRGRLAANLGEKLTAFSPVRVFGRVQDERSRLDRHSRNLAAAAVAHTRLAALMRTLPDATLPAATAMTILVGLIQPQPASAGALLAALLIVNLLAAPMRDLTQIFVFRQNYRAARDVLSGFLALPTLVPSGQGAPPLASGPGSLAFDDVTVAGSLRNVTVVAEPRTLVAITGPSGSGKSTLLALAARLFDPDHGTVRIDGHALADCDLDSVRRAIGMITPELPLLRGSVRRNLTYRASDASDEEIAEALRICALDRAIAGLPGGLEARVVEGGANLPAGIRQRLVIARAILGEPRLLLIDDVDALGGDPAVEALTAVARSRRATILMVTTNPRWIRIADAVWQLENGRLLPSYAGSATSAFDDRRPA